MTTYQNFQKINSLVDISRSTNKLKEYNDVKNFKRDLDWKLTNSENFINEHF